MTDNNKPLPQTYLKVSQTAVTMFGRRQFNRKRGALRNTNTTWLLLHFPSIREMGERNRREGGAGGEGGFLCRKGKVGRRRVALLPLGHRNCFRA